jgi:hypothetical protein
MRERRILRKARKECVICGQKPLVKRRDGKLGVTCRKCSDRNYNYWKLKESK